MRAHGAWRRAAWAASVAALMLAEGCQGPLSRSERVEMLMARSAQLEEELQEARERLAQLEGAEAAVSEAPRAGVPEDPFRAVALRFGKYTGGLAADGRPGNQMLKVILEPLDAEGDVVKRAGSLELEVLELGGAVPTPLARWAWPAEEFAKTWLSGVGLYGYVLKLEWPSGRPPAGERVLLRARFTTLSGEVLETEKELALAAEGG